MIAGLAQFLLLCTAWFTLGYSFGHDAGRRDRFLP